MSNDVLMSIKPRFSQAILSREKVFEFRLRGFKRSPSQVFIYETAPTKGIVGMFTVSKVLRDRPEKLWEECKVGSGLEREEFDAYFAGRDSGSGEIVHDNDGQYKFVAPRPEEPSKTSSEAEVVGATQHSGEERREFRN